MTFYYTLLEHYQLMESLDSIIASNPHIPKLIISGYHKDALPDNNKNDRLLNHVLKMHDDGDITPETAHLLKPHLTALSNTNQLNKLGSLNTLEDHINATKDIMDKSVTKKERIDMNTPVIANTDDILVHQHLNHESAIKGARLHHENPMYKETSEHGKAQWCVSVDDENGKGYYSDYTHSGKYPMYTITNKKTKRKTAFVADPSRKYDENSNGIGATLEIRDEKDNLKSPYSLLVNNPGLEKTPIGDFFRKNEPSAMRSLEILPHTATKERIERMMTNGWVDGHHSAILEHPNVNSDHIHTILHNNDIPSSIKVKALKHPKVHEDDVNEFARSGNILLRDEALLSNKLSDENINWAISQDKHTLRAVLPNANLDSERLGNIIKTHGNDIQVLEAAMYNPNATTEHINHVLDKGKAFTHAKRVAIKHQNVGVSEINKALDDDDEYVRGSALSNPKVNDDHITKAMRDHESWIVHKAILNKAATKEHFLKGLEHDDEGVREESALKLAELSK
jgi:hypothetical protein